MVELDTVKAEPDPLKQLPPNIAKLKKPVRKEWARKLIPVIKAAGKAEANKLIAMECFLSPRTVNTPYCLGP